MIAGVLVGVAGLAVLLWLMDHVTSRLWSFALDGEGVALVFLHRYRWWRLPYAEIQAVEVASLLEVILDKSLRGFRAWGIHNRAYAWFTVVLRRRNGRAVLITPDDPAAFASKLKTQLLAASGPGTGSQTERGLTSA